MFTSFVFPKSSAAEGRGREGKGRGELELDEGMLKTGRVHSAASREATENGASVLYPIPLLLLFRSDTVSLAHMPVCMCIVYLCVRAFVGEAHISPAVCYSPSSGTPTSWHAAHMSLSTR